MKTLIIALLASTAIKAETAYSDKLKVCQAISVYMVKEGIKAHDQCVKDQKKEDEKYDRMRKKLTKEEYKIVDERRFHTSCDLIEKFNQPEINDCISYLAYKNLAYKRGYYGNDN